MSVPFQLGIQASPAISVTTNGPLPTLMVSLTVFVLASTIATLLSRTLGTQTSPPTTAGSPRLRADHVPSRHRVRRRIDARDVAVELRDPDGGVRGRRPGRALERDPLQDAVGAGVDAHDRVVLRLGDPEGAEGATTPLGLVPVRILRTTLFVRGLIRSSVPPTALVAQAAPNA